MIAPSLPLSALCLLTATTQFTKPLPPTNQPPNQTRPPNTPQGSTGAESLYSNFKRRPGPIRGESQPIGPVQYEPYGRRFSIDGNKVKWMGWEMDVGNKPTSGPRLWDIRFKGERIIYELSIQEAMAGALFFRWREGAAAFESDFECVSPRQKPCWSGSPLLPHHQPTAINHATMTHHPPRSLRRR